MPITIEHSPSYVVAGSAMFNAAAAQQARENAERQRAFELQQNRLRLQAQGQSQAHQRGMAGLRLNAMGMAMQQQAQQQQMQMRREEMGQRAQQFQLGQAGAMQRMQMQHRNNLQGMEAENRLRQQREEQDMQNRFTLNTAQQDMQFWQDVQQKASRFNPTGSAKLQKYQADLEELDKTYDNGNGQWTFPEYQKQRSEVLQQARGETWDQYAIPLGKKDGDVYNIGPHKYINGPKGPTRVGVDMEALEPEQRQEYVDSRIFQQRAPNGQVITSGTIDNDGNLRLMTKPSDNVPNYREFDRRYQQAYKLLDDQRKTTIAGQEFEGPDYRPPGEKEVFKEMQRLEKLHQSWAAHQSGEAGVSGVDPGAPDATVGGEAPRPGAPFQGPPGPAQAPLHGAPPPGAGGPPAPGGAPAPAPPAFPQAAQQFGPEYVQQAASTVRQRLEQYQDVPEENKPLVRQVIGQTALQMNRVGVPVPVTDPSQLEILPAGTIVELPDGRMLQTGK